MKGKRGLLLVLVCGGMELSWLYAWANFTMISIVHRPFPLPEAAGIFALAALLTIIPPGRGWRVIHILGLQLLGMVLAASRVVFFYFYRSSPYLSKNWLFDFFNHQRDPMEWFTLVLILFWVLLFWLGGLFLVRRPKAYLTICSRFDLGVAAFFLLFLVKLIAMTEAGVELRDPLSLSLLFPFFIFSLLAIGLVRNRGEVQKDFLSGYRGIGVILSFTLVVLLFSSGIMLLFLPYLRLAAKVSYELMKTAAEPLGPILANVLRFIFIHGRSPRETPPASTGESDLDIGAANDSGWLPDLLEKILGWGLLGLIGLIALMVSALLAWYLIRWLLSRSATGGKKQGFWEMVLSWVPGLWELFVFLWKKITTGGKGFEGAVQIYAKLLNWGRRSGLPHLLAETPMEYGCRLRQRFPSMRSEIGMIIDAFNHEVFGEVVLQQERLVIIARAWRKLRSPLNWPTRTRSWFFKE